MRDRRGLPGRSGGSGRCRAHITCGATSNEPAANLFCDVELATAKSPRSDDGVAWPAIAWSFRLEEPERSFRAVSRPHSSDSSVGFAQRLRRTHTKILPSLPDFSAPTRLQAAGNATGLSGEELPVLSHELAGRKRRTFGIRQHGQTNVRGVERWD